MIKLTEQAIDNLIDDLELANGYDNVDGISFEGVTTIFIKTSNGVETLQIEEMEL